MFRYRRNHFKHVRGLTYSSWHYLIFILLLKEFTKDEAQEQHNVEEY